MTKRDLYEDLIKRYVIVKETFIECEEYDKNMKTNLQPANEFKATLDHLFNMLANEEDEERFKDEYKKAKSHLGGELFSIYVICFL